MAGEIILIVEDNDVLRQGLQALLEAEGFSVNTAIHGLDGLEKVKSCPPDLILADISMPEMDGYAFFEAVRARPEWVSIPFIFLTARRGREDVFAGKKLGAEDYLIKPVTRQELVTTIRSRMARSHQLLLAQLQQAYKSSLIMLANAIELRDQYTGGHVERVRDYAAAIAEQMGWTTTRINHLNYGSILHDIGKIHILENVLSKPGPLNEDEWAGDAPASDDRRGDDQEHPLPGVRQWTWCARTMSAGMAMDTRKGWLGRSSPSQPALWRLPTRWMR